MVARVLQSHALSLSLSAIGQTIDSNPSFVEATYNTDIYMFTKPVVSGKPEVLYY